MTFVSNSTNGQSFVDRLDTITNMVNAQAVQLLTGKHPTGLPTSQQSATINRAFAAARAAGLTDFDILQVILEEMQSAAEAHTKAEADKTAEIEAREAAAAKAAEQAQQPALMVLPPVAKKKSSKRKVSNGRQ